MEFQNEIIERPGWFSPAERVRMDRDLHLEKQMVSEGSVPAEEGGRRSTLSN